MSIEYWPNGMRKGKAENFPTFLSSSSSIVLYHGFDIKLHIDLCL
jgi:hypothetical protein